MKEGELKDKITLAKLKKPSNRVYIIKETEKQIRAITTFKFKRLNQTKSY